jgi:GAF domain-containing protein
VSGLTHWLLEPHPSITVLERLTDRATAVVGLAGSGILLDIDGALGLATAMPDAVADLEQVQEREQAGPGVEAYRSGHVVTVPDLSLDDRWPAFAERAVATGMPAAAGIPLRAGRVHVGALTAYAAVPGEWLEDDVAALTALADLATGCLLNASRRRDQDDLVRQLRTALESRVVIEQAKGFLAAERGLNPQEAFGVLRQHAREHNLPLRALAAVVVRERGLPGEDPTRGSSSHVS